MAESLDLDKTAKLVLGYIKLYWHLYAMSIVDRDTGHQALTSWTDDGSKSSIDCSCGKNFYRKPGMGHTYYPDHWLTKEAAKKQEEYYRGTANAPIVDNHGMDDSGSTLRERDIPSGKVRGNEQPKQG